MPSRICHKGVANRLDLVALVLFDESPDELVVQIQRGGHLLRYSGPQRGAALNVGEEYCRGFG